MKTDVHLQRDVLEELDGDPSVQAAQIGVTTKDGVVTLTGHVPVYGQKRAAEEVTKRIHGVRAIANEIEVRPTSVHVRDDEDIAAAAVHALEWDAKVPDAQLQVTVDNGWVTIDGRVEQPFQKSATEQAVDHLPGVRGVSNVIVVAPREMAREVEMIIEAALRRSAALSTRELSIETDGPCVTLMGDVHSYAEMEEAERIASYAPGVQHVRNCITVTPWGFGPAEEWGY